MSTNSAVLSPVSTRSHLRLTARGRFVVAVLALVPAVLGVLASVGGASASGETGVLHYVQVESGQSLWQVAEGIAPGSDTSEVVSDLVHFNDLESFDVLPGQELAVPVEYLD